MTDQSNTQSESQISHGGSLRALQDLEFNNNSVIKEKIDNMTDRESRENILYIDEENKLVFATDKSLHGASIKRLNEISCLHHRKPANVETQGLKSVGEKAFGVYATNLYCDLDHIPTEENPAEYTIDKEIKTIFEKREIDRTPIEDLKIAPRYISHTDEFAGKNDKGWNTQVLDFITPVHYGGEYKNTPRPTSALDEGIWDAFMPNREILGTIGVMPYCKKSLNELMDSLVNKDIEENLLLFLGNVYYELLRNGTKIIIIKIANLNFNVISHFETKVTYEIRETFEVQPFDPLHFDVVEDKHKISGSASIYKKKADLLFSDEEQEKRKKYTSSADKRAIFKYDNNPAYLKMKISKNKKDFEVIENLETEMEYYSYVGKCDLQGTYDHGTVIPGKTKTTDVWKQDEKYLKEIYKCESIAKLKNKTSLNGTYTNRNKKQVSHSLPKNLSKGDFSLRKANKDCRFRRSYDSDIDHYIPPLLNKSRLDWSKAFPELQEILNLAEQKFKTYISGLYYTASLPADEDTKPKPDKKIQKGKKPSVIIEKDSDDDDDDGDEESISSLSSSDESELTTRKQNVQLATAKSVVVNVPQTEQEEEIIDDDSASSFDSDSSKINKLAAAVPLESQPENINLALSEEVSDSASSSDSESSHSSKLVVDIKKVIRKESKVDIIPKEISLQQLRDWLAKPEFHDELENHLLIIWSEVYNDLIHEDVFEDIYPQLDIQTKVNLLIKHINNKYKSKNVQIAGASGLNIAYKAYVK